MVDWLLKQSDLKRYPHFDSLISASEAQALATDRDRVARHKFFPFMRYVQRWTRFSKKGQKGKPKERPIRYAARADAYIFSYYRHVLSERYEAELAHHQLGSNVLAYRRLRGADSLRGKCNIDFARDAIIKIQELQNCCAIALDISGFFESLDHTALKQLWCRMLGVSRLPPDHFRVFEAITRYAVVDKQSVYERLGHFGEKRKTKSERPIKGYLTPFRQMPKKLCTGKEFRAKIAGGGADKSIIQMNFKPYGIPQGAPISDLLANLYLLDFDRTVREWASALGGAYYRYSDDILILVPGDEYIGRDVMARVRALIPCFGSRLQIKEEKSSLLVYRQLPDRQDFMLAHGKQGRNGLEYLGFRFDGRRAYIRDSTLSNLRRKVARAARRDAMALARRYPDKDLSYLRTHFDYERLVARFGRVEDFEEKQGDFRNWTFWTYAIRAAKIFGPLGAHMPRQLKNHRRLVRNRADHELERAIVMREMRKSGPS